ADNADALKEPASPNPLPVQQPPAPGVPVPSMFAVFILRISWRPCRLGEEIWLLRCHPQRPVEPDDLAVQHHIANDVLDERRVLLRPSKPRGKGHLGGERRVYFFAHTRHHRSFEYSRGDGHDPYSQPGKLAR